MRYVLILLLFFASTAYGTVYSWVDYSGIRHYANRMTGVYRLTAYLGGLSNLPELPFSTSKSPNGTTPLFPTQSPVLAHYDDDGNFVGFY